MVRNLKCELRGRSKPRQPFHKEMMAACVKKPFSPATTGAALSYISIDETDASNHLPRAILYAKKSTYCDGHDVLNDCILPSTFPGVLTNLLEHGFSLDEMRDEVVITCSILTTRS